jgi:uncharacterized protein YbjT (DUF2867 family)
MTGPVLVVGGTGMLGSQVATELLKRGKPVRALVRSGSDASRLEAAGVEIARGDMLDAWSLLRAMEGVDAVVTSAAGYTRHRKGDTPKTDTVGNINLVEAAKRTGVRRFVLTSILTCDQTPQISHFRHKKLTEDRLEDLGVPFVALRPGAFLDQVTRFGGDPFSKGRLTFRTWTAGASTSAGTGPWACRTSRISPGGLPAKPSPSAPFLPVLCGRRGPCLAR